MKKVMSLALSLMLIPGLAFAEAAETARPVGDEAGLTLVGDLYQEGQNLVLSPSSLTAALGMTAEGAKGETLGQLLSLLGAEGVDALAHAVPEGVESANAVFAAQGLSIEKAFLEALNEKYGAEWFEIDDEIVQSVNDWVMAHTNGLIDQLLTEQPDPDTGMILVNAVAMDNDWLFAFDGDLTQTQAFHAAAGDVDVEMMQQTEWLDYMERDGTQYVRLPYEKGKLDMWVMLPQAGGVPALLAELSESGLAAMTAGTESTQLQLSLPKTDISFETALSEPLKALGLIEAFSDGADFSGITADVPMKIAEIFQKARLQMDEAGTKAAAATAVIMECMAIQMEGEESITEMTVDRPFVFAIADRETGAVCFAGVVENPVE